MNWSRWNWLDDGALPLAVIILRTCWIWIGLAWLQRWLAPDLQMTILPVGLVLGVLLAGTSLARWALRLPAIRARAAAAAIGFLVVFAVMWWQLYRGSYSFWDVRWISIWATDMVTWTDWETRGIPASVFAFFALVFVWLRGLLDGGRLYFLRENIWGVFASGFVALALVLLLAQLDQAGLPDGSGNLLWLFFATGMVALAIAGLRDAGGLLSPPGEEGSAAEARLGFDRYWMGSVVLVMGGLLVLALAISTVVAPDSASQVLRAVWVVARQGIIYLWFAISLLLLPIAYVLALVLAPLLDRLAGIQLEFQRGVREAFTLEQLQESEQGISVVERLPAELRWVAFGVMIVFVGLAFAAALRRLLTAVRKDDVMETRESVLSRDLLEQQLSDLWRSLRSRLEREPKREFNPFLSLDGETDTRRTIRSAYQAFLASAQEWGLPRRRSLTPFEFQVDVEQVWLHSAEAVRVITDGYVEARYAPDPPSIEQANRVREAWEGLQGALSAQESGKIDVE